MFDKEEKLLKQLGQEINNVSIPDNIEDFIKKGIEKGNFQKKREKRKIFVNVAAILAFSVFIIAIRVSPVFASAVSRVPGLSYVVKLINYDKGIAEAVNNNFVQNINISEEHEGLVLTIKDIIMDKSRAVIFYSVENKTNHRFVEISKINFEGEDGKNLQYSYAMQGLNKDMNIEKKLEGQVDLSFTEENVIPDKFIINIKLKESDSNEYERDKDKELDSIWNFKVPIDKKKFESLIKTYEINKTVEVEGQKITFKKITVYPLRIAVDIEYDKNNAKKILHYDDLAILNEKGEKWGSIVNAVGGALTDEYHTTLYFQSNFFTNPKEIYIAGNSIRAIDKDKLQVIVDVENSKLIKAPDEKLILKSVLKEAKGTTLEFNLLKDEILDKNYAYAIFNSSMEVNGEKYNVNSMSFGMEGDKGRVEFTIPSEAGNVKNISLDIQDYPSRIKGEFKVKVK